MLHNFPFNTDIIHLLNTYGTKKKFKKGEFIIDNTPNIENSFIVLMDGGCKILSNKNNGSSFLYAFEATPNTPVVIYCTKLKIDHNLNIKAIKDCDIIIMSHSSVKKLKVAHEDIQYLFENSLKNIYANIVVRMLEISSLSLDKNLFKYLKTQTLLHKSNELTIPISEIAEDLNFSREAISRSLKKLEDDQLIIKKSRAILVL